MPAHEKRLDEQFTETEHDESESDEGSDELEVEQPQQPSLAALGFGATPYQSVAGLPLPPNQELRGPIDRDFQPFDPAGKKYVAYTIKLPSDQLAALQTIWLELKRLYGAHSPDKSGMIQQAITDWLKRWDGPERQSLLQDLLEIRQDTRRRQYRK